MLDINLIRESPEIVRANLERRKNPEYLNMFDELIELYFSFTLFCYILVDYFYLLKYKRPYDFEFPKQS